MTRPSLRSRRISLSYSGHPPKGAQCSTTRPAPRGTCARVPYRPHAPPTPSEIQTRSRPRSSLASSLCRGRRSVVSTTSLAPPLRAHASSRLVSSPLPQRSRPALCTWQPPTVVTHTTTHKPNLDARSTRARASRHRLSPGVSAAARAPPPVPSPSRLSAARSAGHPSSDRRMELLLPSPTDVPTRR